MLRILVVFRQCCGSSRLFPSLCLFAHIFTVGTCCSAAFISTSTSLCASSSFTITLVPKKPHSHTACSFEENHPSKNPLDVNRFLNGISSPTKFNTALYKNHCKASDTTTQKLPAGPVLCNQPLLSYKPTSRRRLQLGGFPCLCCSAARGGDVSPPCLRANTTIWLLSARFLSLP